MSRIRRLVAAVALTYCAAGVSLGFLLAACASAPQSSPNARALGAPSALGNGTVAGYAEFDVSGAVTAIGVVFSGGVLDNLPAAPSDGHHCFDMNKDGTIDLAAECASWHERVLPLPSEASRQPDLPFKWALLNWNPHGHIPPGVYDKPHFDVHFYIEPIEKVFAIESGPCGPEHVRCDQFTQARLPVPANYMHPDFKDVEAVAPAMGNHLVDPKAPEFNGVPFTHTWIYGVYEGPRDVLRADGDRRVPEVAPGQLFPDQEGGGGRLGWPLPDPVVHPLSAHDCGDRRIARRLRAARRRATGPVGGACDLRGPCASKPAWQREP